MSTSEVKPKLYVGCSLARADEEFRQNVEKLKNQIRKNGYEVFDFVGLVKGTPRDVYEWDMGHCVKDCDIFLAICDEPSIGLGMEIHEAIRLGKPVLGVASKDSVVTRMIDGAAEVKSNFTFLRYTDFMHDVPLMLEDFIKKQTG